jgi:photosystem II stability/assembly factor-like uncharacterized protein
MINGYTLPSKSDLFMKRIFSLLVFAVLHLVCSSPSAAQNSASYFRTWESPSAEMPEWARLMYGVNPHVPTVTKLHDAYYAEHTFVKTTHTQNYKFWLKQVANKLDANGYIKPPVTPQALQAEAEKLMPKKTTNQRIAGATSCWFNVGPKRVYRTNESVPSSFNCNVYSIEQSLSNPNLVICGSESGGVHKSTDMGLTWQPITNQLPYAGGNTAVAIHPTDDQQYLIWGGNLLFKTIDGGANWTLITIGTTETANEIKYNPSNPDTVYMTGLGGLWRSINAGDTWTQIFTEDCYDVDFHPTNHNIVFLLKANPTNKRCEVFKSTNGGQTWTLTDNGYYLPADPANAIIKGGKIAMSSVSPNSVYLCLIDQGKVGDNGWTGVYQSHDLGATWTRSAAHDGAPYGTINNTTTPWNVAAYNSGTQQGFYNFDFEASATTPGLLWVGTIRLSETADSGKTFTSIGAAESMRLLRIHPDVQSISVNGSHIFVATDGGVDYSNDNLQTQQYRSYNLTDVNFWQFNTGWNEMTFTGGTYHNSTMGWTENYGVEAYEVGGIEEPSGYVHPINDRQLVFRTHYSSSGSTVAVLPDAIGQPIQFKPNLPIYPNESYDENRTSGFFWHPLYANIMFVGFENKIYKSTNSGLTWAPIYALSNTAGKIFEIEISMHNPQVMYCTFNPDGGYWTGAQMMKSIDGGNTWTSIDLGPSTSNAWTWKIAMTVNPSDENDIWIAIGNLTGTTNKIYQSTNGGASFSNRSTSALNNNNIYDITYVGAQNALVYAFGSLGVYYYNTSTSSWVSYSTGLPTYTSPLRIHTNFASNQLIAGSGGRGAWVRDFADTLYAPIANFAIDKDTIACTRDTVTLVSKSRINNQGASFNWTITPTPAYVSSTTSKIVKIVFGTPGNYSISLDIQDATGATSTKSIPNVVNVGNACSPDTLATTSLALTGATTSYALGAPLNVTTNNLTISAWIKRNGTQPGTTTGVISMRDAYGNGINLSSSSALRYVWDGYFTSWNSGHVIPDNKWVHVALVITPTRGILYMDGVPKFNNASHGAVTLSGALNIGRDITSNTRMFKGEIDEVCIWNRALDSNEIRSLSHLTKEDTINDPTFIAYYQFNEGNIRAYDKKGFNHLDIAATGTATLSTAPVGSGSSHHLAVNAPGVYNFSNAGTELTFAAGTVPYGNVVVTRLNVSPDSATTHTNLHNQYWIINNYGTNSTFTTLSSLKFYPTDGVTESIAWMEKRSSNEHLSNWTDQCTSASTSIGPNGYYQCNNTCNQNSFSQFAFTQYTVPLTAQNLLLKATFNNITTELTWSALDIKNVNQFTLAYSTDGNQFNDIFETAVVGKNYSYNFHNIASGNVYFRVTQYNKDGSKAYSNVVKLFIPYAAKLWVSPNPVKAGSSVTINGLKASNARVRILNTKGQIVARPMLVDNQFKIEPQLATGIYYYMITSDTEMYNGTLEVQ